MPPPSSSSLWHPAAPVRLQLRPGHRGLHLRLRLWLRSIHVSRSLSATRHHLVGAGGARISCYGFRIIPLQFQCRRFTLIFEIADVKKPILGADFLTVNGLVVGVSNSSPSTGSPSTGSPCTGSPCTGSPSTSSPM